MIAGDDAVGEIRTVPLGIVTPVATAIVEVLDIVPMITSTLSTLTSLVASWTAGAVAVWSSRASTIWTEILLLRPSLVSAWLIVSTASCAAALIDGPVAESAPVNGRIVPRRSWNDGVVAVLDDVCRVEAAAVAAARTIASRGTANATSRLRPRISPP